MLGMIDSVLVERNLIIPPTIGDTTTNTLPFKIASTAFMLKKLTLIGGDVYEWSVKAGAKNRVTIFLYPCVRGGLPAATNYDEGYCESQPVGQAKRRHYFVRKQSKEEHGRWPINS